MINLTNKQEYELSKYWEKIQMRFPELAECIKMMSAEIAENGCLSDATRLILQQKLEKIDKELNNE